MNEVNEISKIAIASLFLIDAEDKIRQCKWYKFNLKKTGTAFFSELRKYEEDLYSKLDKTGANKKSIDNFFNEYLQSVKSMNNIMDVQMNLKNDNQRNYLKHDLEQLMKKYDGR